MPENSYGSSGMGGDHSETGGQAGMEPAKDLRRLSDPSSTPRVQPDAQEPEGLREMIKDLIGKRVWGQYEQMKDEVLPDINEVTPTHVETYIAGLSSMLNREVEKRWSEVREETIEAEKIRISISANDIKLRMKSVIRSAKEDITKDTHIAGLGKETGLRMEIRNEMQYIMINAIKRLDLAEKWNGRMVEAAERRAMERLGRENVSIMDILAIEGDFKKAIRSAERMLGDNVWKIDTQVRERMRAIEPLVKVEEMIAERGEPEERPMEQEEQQRIKVWDGTVEMAKNMDRERAMGVERKDPRTMQEYLVQIWSDAMQGANQEEWNMLSEMGQDPEKRGPVEEETNELIRIVRELNALSQREPDNLDGQMLLDRLRDVQREQLKDTIRTEIGIYLAMKRISDEFRLE